jgi:hypothetical protein
MIRLISELVCQIVRNIIDRIRASMSAPDSPVKVYILMGQSNMLGMGTIGDQGSGDGSLYYACHSKGLYPYLLSPDGQSWKTREDVRHVFTMGNALEAGKLLHNEWMTVAGKTIGPELGIGHEVRILERPTTTFFSSKITGGKQQHRPGIAPKGLHWQSVFGLGSASSWFPTV